MGADTALYVHQAPVFLCAPARVETRPQQVKDAFINGAISSNAVVPWPYWTNVRFKVLEKQPYDAAVLEIIRNKLTEWMTALNPPLSVQWVPYNEPADVRIAFRSDIPSWSAIGPQAQKYDQGQHTMNFNLAGWDKDRKVVYTHRQIERIALHLMGHALGLPHAENKWTAKWDDVKVKDQLGEIALKFVSQDKGGFANPAGSIMQFDLPAALSTTPTVDDRQGTFGIDGVAKQQLQRVYVRPQDVALTQIRADKVRTAKWDNHSEPTKYAEQTIETSRTAQRVTALNTIDFRVSENWRISSRFEHVQDGFRYTVKLDGWWSTQIDTASCDALSFDVGDGRVQSGSYSILEKREGEVGVIRTHTQRFWKAFDKEPEVVVFISGFDIDHGTYLRVRTFVTRKDKNEFDVSLGSWADTRLYSIEIYWVAHSADSASIRSGSVGTGNSEGKKTYTEQAMPATFSSPMASRPRYIFRGFNFIDLSKDQNPRAAFEVQSWDQAGFKARFATWGGNNRFFDLNGSYVAIS